MLTKDLLRYRIRQGVVEPQLLRATPALLALAEALLAHYRGQIGQTQAAVEEAAQPVLYRARSLVVARGLRKLVQDACAFADPADAAAFRRTALQAAAASLIRAPESVSAHRQAVAAELAVTPRQLTEGLYADLPEAAVLEQAPEWSAQELIDRYNLAQVQGLLLRADTLTVQLATAEPGASRQLLKALRFHRLLAEITRREAGLRLEIGGPGSVLDQAARYGMQLALFLPALACAPAWSAEATVRLERERARLRIGVDTGLRGSSAYLGYIPDELRELGQRLEAKLSDWRILGDPEPLLVSGGEIVVPDFAVATGVGPPVPVELIHRWHAACLERRLRQLAAGELPQLVLGVDRAVAKRSAYARSLSENPCAERIFHFSGFPVARAVRSSVEAVLAG